MHPALPSFLREQRSSPRTTAVIAGAVGSGACAYAGIYPGFDEGALRPLMGVLAAAAGALVVGRSFEKPDAASACPKAVGLSGLLGMLVPVVPSVLLCSSSTGGSAFAFALMTGAVTGLPTGLLYGLFLAILVGYVHPHGVQPTLAGPNRAWRAAGLWTLLCVLLALARFRLDERPAGVDVGLCLLVGLGSAALIVTIVAQIWLVSTRRWVARVHAENEPHLRIRPRSPSDELADLPWVSGTLDTVVAWAPRTDGAYRDNAADIPICFVEDPPGL